MRKLSLLKMVCIVLVFCTATAIASPAQIFTTLYSFTWDDGALPPLGLYKPPAATSTSGTILIPWRSVNQIQSGVMESREPICLLSSLAGLN